MPSLVIQDSSVRLEEIEIMRSSDKVRAVEWRAKVRVCWRSSGIQNKQIACEGERRKGRRVRVDAGVSRECYCTNMCEQCQCI